MMMLFDFKCNEGHVFEKLVKSDVKEATCPNCDSKALRIISPVSSILETSSGHFPGATMKWARQRQQQIKKERKTS